MLGVYNNIHAMMQTFWFEHSGVYIYILSILWSTQHKEDQMTTNQNRTIKIEIITYVKACEHYD